MYQREFENLLHKNPPRAILLYGDNEYTINSYIQHYINITDTSNSLLTLYFDDYSFDKAKRYLSQTSLFGGANMLIIKRDKKIPKKELDILISLVNKNIDSFFIFHFKGKASSAKSLQSSFSPKNGGNWVRLFEPNINQSINILYKKSMEIGLDIDHSTLQHLMLLLNNNLELSANELNKLAILKGRVTSKDIDRLVYSTAPLAIEDLLVDLFENRPIIKKVNQILDLGEDEFYIVRSTEFFVNQLFLFHAYFKLNGNIDSKAILGYKLPKDIEQQKGVLSLKIKSSTLLKIYESLFELEIEMKKSSSIDRESLLYGAFIKIQSFL